MHLIVLPTQTLRDAQTPPLVLPQQLQGSPRSVKIVAWDGFEHVFGELDVAVFIFGVAVSDVGKWWWLVGGCSGGVEGLCVLGGGNVAGMGRWTEGVLCYTSMNSVLSR